MKNHRNEAQTRRRQDIVDFYKKALNIQKTGDAFSISRQRVFVILHQEGIKTHKEIRIGKCVKCGRHIRGWYDTCLKCRFPRTTPYIHQVYTGLEKCLECRDTLIKYNRVKFYCSKCYHNLFWKAARREYYKRNHQQILFRNRERYRLRKLKRV